MKKLILAMCNVDSHQMEYVNFDEVLKFSQYSNEEVLITYTNGNLERFWCQDFKTFVNRVNEELTNGSSGIIRF